MANFRTLDLNLLRVFDELMAERNLTRAAANLAMTQPAASNALRRLRDFFGDALVVRAGYGVQPTPFAAALWPGIRQSLGQMREAIAPSQFDPATAQISFLLAMADSTATQLIPHLLAIIERSAPGVNLRVMPLTTRDPRPMLARDDIHAAIGFFPAVVGAIALQNHEDSGDAYDHASLYGGEYVCVMRRDHPLTRRTLTLDRYCAARHLLVSFSGRPHGFVDESLARLQRSRRIVLTVNQFFTAGQVVAQSDLLTVLPRHFLAATGVRAELAVRKLPFAMPPVDVDILWHRRLGDRPGQAWLRDQIQQAAQSAFARSKAGRRS